MENTDFEYQHLSLENFITKSAFHAQHGWEDFKRELTANDIQQIVDIIGGQHKTKRRIETALLHNLQHIRIGSFASRIILDQRNNRWRYCAGQDYPAEIKTIRQLIK